MGFERSPMDVVVESTIKDLVTANYEDTDSVLSRSSVISYDFCRPHRVLAGVFHQDIKPLRGSLVRRIQTLVGKDGIGCCIGEELVVLLNADADHMCFAKQLIEDIYTQFKCRILIGIGNVVEDIEKYALSYQSAKKALDIGEYTISKEQIYSLEKFNIHALFLSSIKQEELYKFAKEQIGPLVNYDEQNNTVFSVTLQEFLFQRNNIIKTTRSLNLSVSGLKYRLKKAESILKISLNDYKACLDIQLAFIIMQLFGEGEYKINRI